MEQLLSADYWTQLWDIRDKRLDGWFMMDSPWPTVLLSISYVYSVTVLGPTLMKDRPAFSNLKMPIQLYNIIQVALSAYVVYEASAAGWATTYSWACQDVDRSSDPNGDGMRMARITWIYFLSKFVEFFDTFFFIARKKFSHVSALQVIHHGIMPVFAYCLTRWLPGGQESFGGLINSVVHVLMYSYYFLAALGPQMQPYLWWKKYLTTFQMIQFATVFTKSLVVIFGLSPGCGYPWQFSVITSCLMILFFGLFLNFYIQEYKNKPRKGKSSGKKVE